MSKVPNLDSQSARQAKSAKRKVPDASDAKTVSNEVAESATDDAKADAQAVDPSEEKRKKLHARPDRASTLPVVGIGASAGGLDAYKRFFHAMPPDSGMAFVLIQHLDPNHQSLMAELLSNYTTMPVVEARDATKLEPNKVYMIPPNKFLKVYRSGLFLEEPVKERGIRLPIDFFFRTLAEDRKERAIAIILSGTGSDGTLGAKEIKGSGGIVLVQRPDSAEYDGMPRSAAATGIVDFVLPIEEMPAVLTRYVQHPYVGGREGERWLDEVEPDHFRSIINLLRAHTDYDFRCYKKGTLLRRIQRRMGLLHLQTLGEYLIALRKDSEEISSLFRDLLIGVTRFFRDKEAWSELEEVAAEIVKSKKGHDAVRVWVPGCSTGEEAYSLAMVFLEQFEEQKKSLDLQVFGTDLDPHAVESARTGAYPASIAVDVPTVRLRRFFVERDEQLQVVKRLREATVFAVQNLIADPPFSKLDLISCRNVLIYLDAPIQSKLIEMFHFALADVGVLFLGTSESVGKRPHLFDSISKPWRLYRKTGPRKYGALNFPIAGNPSKPRTGLLTRDRLGGPGDKLETTADRSRKTLLSRFAPAAVAIDHSNEIQYLHGPIRNYLDFPEGEFTRDLPSMALRGLRSKIRGLIHRCRQEGQSVSAVATRVQREGEYVGVEVTAQPVPGPDDGLVLVTFQDVQRAITPEKADGAPEEETTDAKSVSEEDPNAVRQLEYELKATREDLQTTIEELETANEELKASNEEVMSMNEELQSTNEELETSREELQSLNEELSTVNSQLEDKVDEVESTNNDLNNLLVSTDIATVFLDSTTRIRRFTPAAADLLNLIAGDIGRPISDLAPRVHDEDLLTDARSVLERLVVSEKEVRNGDGCSYIRKIRPFRTSDNKIEGVVVTFADITGLVDARNRLEQRERQQASVAALGRLALGTEDLKKLFRESVHRVHETLGVDYTKVLELLPGHKGLLLRDGVGWKSGLVGSATIGAGLDSQAGYTLAASGPVIVADLRKETRFSGPPLLTDHGVISGLSVIVGRPEDPWGVLGVHTKSPRIFTPDDVNFIQSVAHVLGEAIRLRRADLGLREAADRLRLSQEAGGVGSWDWDLVKGTTTWSQKLYEILGQDPASEATPERFFELVHPDDRARLRNAVEEAMRGGRHYEEDFRITRGDGADRWLHGKGEVIFRREKPVRMVGINTDITDRKRALQAAAEAKEIQQLALEAGGLGHWDWDLLNGGVNWGPGTYRLYGLDSPDAASTTESALALIHEDDRERAQHEAMHAWETAGPYESEFRVRWPDGTVRWLLARGRIIETSPEGKPSRMIGINMDITHRKQIEEALRKEDGRKDRFLATLAHELRNPLAPIVSGLEMLRLSGDDPGQRERVVRTVERQARHLVVLVDDLLDISRLTRDTLTLRRSNVDLRTVIEEALESARPSVLEKDHVLDVKLPKESIAVYADSHRLVQAFSNLICNSAKFTPRRGRIWVKAGVDDREVTISVKDTGIGIPKEDQEKVFDIFERGRDGENASSQGLGIGLTLARALVQEHGGRINVESEGAGHGAEFIVVLPRAAESAEGQSETVGATTEIATGSEARRILVVDDNRAAAEMLHEVLENLGHQVQTAFGGEEAVELAAEFRPEVILLDVGMPGIDGFEVARRIRNHEWGQKALLVAVTGWGRENDREKTREAGFDRHLVKPVKATEIQQTIEAANRRSDETSTM